MEINWNLCGRKELKRDKKNLSSLKNFLIDYTKEDDGVEVLKQLATVRDAEIIVSELLHNLKDKV